MDPDIVAKWPLRVPRRSHSANMTIQKETIVGHMHVASLSALALVSGDCNLKDRHCAALCYRGD